MTEKYEHNRMLDHYKSNKIRIDEVIDEVKDEYAEKLQQQDNGFGYK